ncbi:MAG: HD-GYP domain-containing protein [Bacillota bacterium]
MRLARLSPGLEGKVLGNTILAADGNALLVAGTTLTLSFVRRLQSKGYRFVYVDDETSSGIEPDEVIDAQTRSMAFEAVQRSLKCIAERTPIDSGRVSHAVEDIVESIKRRAGVTLSIATIRTLDEYTFVHSLNVCILALIIGLETGLSKAQLTELGVGALLHDVGKVIVPLNVLNKPDELTTEEMALVKIHTIEGFQILRDQPGVSLLSAHVALQHHERMDGTGYPRGLRNGEIHRYARMAAVADVMDALTGPRPYRAGMLPDQARRFVASLANTELDEELVDIVLRRVCAFAAGSAVRLSSGEIAVVARQSTADPARPVVRILVDRRGRPVKPYEIELDRHPDKGISELLSDLPQAHGAHQGH